MLTDVAAGDGGSSVSGFSRGPGGCCRHRVAALHRGRWRLGVPGLDSAGCRVEDLLVRRRFYGSFCLLSLLLTECL